MADVSFSNFSTRLFEQFAQALSVKVLGPGIMIFGDGPDGAREASYRGILPFPSDAERWSGYTVVQAKFMQSPGDGLKDVNWLAEQLRRELDKYVENPIDLECPDNYILITNAKLSPAPSTKRGIGGISKIEKVIESYKDKLKIRDFKIWHYDQIKTYLDVYVDLRRSYSAFLSLSDAFSEIFDFVKDRHPNLRNAMLRYAAREFREQEAVRLQQAGHSSDVPIYIDDVFTDLPFNMSSDSAYLLENGAKRSNHNLNRDQGYYNSILEGMVGIVNLKLDRDGIKYLTEKYKSNKLPNKMLLMGGPGQGKSTVTQYMAQIYRANILKDFSSEIASDIQSSLARLNLSLNTQGVDIDFVKRFPFRLNLPSFADALAKSGGAFGKLGLLHYIADSISEISGTLIGVEELRYWIGQAPVLLILDGLDEVPSGSNRSDVIKCINEFWDEVAEVNGDVALIVTTRPQGYNNELDPNLYVKFELSKLHSEVALKYASRLAAIKLTSQVQRTRVLDRLRDASQNLTTSRLMISPLQVAIMFAIVDQRGEAPNDRWTLFQEYFSVILKREQEKAGGYGKTLQRFERAIKIIHQKAGLILHIKAEKPGATEASFTPDEFSALVRQQLSEDGFEGEELDVYQKDIAQLATQRVVFLVQRTDQQIGFEVRSLQEYMAASSLMSGRELEVQCRLSEIATHSHWRHVFQIAASKCFSDPDSSWYRDTILRICAELNCHRSEAEALTRRGSQLAIDLLVDGLAHDQPIYRGLLLDVAIKSLDVPIAQTFEQLVIICQAFGRKVMEEKLPSYLKSDTIYGRAAWSLIISLSDQPWAANLAVNLWPDDKKFALNIAAGGRISKNTVIQKLFQTALSQSQLHEVLQAYQSALFVDPQFSQYYILYEWISDVPSKDLEVNFLNCYGNNTMSISVRSIAGRHNEVMSGVPSAGFWAIMDRIASFQACPGASILSDIISMLTDHPFKEAIISNRHRFAWPLMTALRVLESEGGAELATSIAAGNFGDAPEWAMAESRWKERGIGRADLDFWTTGKYFDQNVAITGAPPFPTISRTSNSCSNIKWMDQLCDICMAQTELIQTADLIRMVTFAAANFDDTYKFSYEMSSLIVKSWINSKNYMYVEMEVVNRFDSEFLVSLNNRRDLNYCFSNMNIYSKIGMNSIRLVMGDADFSGFLRAILAEFWNEPVKFREILTDDFMRVINKYKADPLASVREAVAACLIAQEKYQNESVEFIYNSLANAPMRGDATRMLYRFVSEQLLNDNFSLEIMQGMLKLFIDNSPKKISSAVENINSILGKRISSLSVEDRWKELAFTADVMRMAI